MGSEHTCVIRGEGKVYCWGNNNSGQIGGGEPQLRLSSNPVEVFEATGAVQITAGHAHTCAVRDDGRVLCWGENGAGQLGGLFPLLSTSNTPIEVEGLADIVQVSAGFRHSCALSEDGRVFCWGESVDGKTGPAAASNVDPVPRGVPLEEAAVRVSVGNDFSCALMSSGKVSCWGQLPGGAMTTSQPQEIPGLTEVEQIDSGELHVCVVRAGEQALCWGSLSAALLGRGSSLTSSEIPARVEGLDKVSFIGAGFLTSCAVEVGRAYCWGRSFQGELGNGGPLDQLSAVASPVAELTKVASLAVGRGHSCALLEDQRVACWGDSTFGQLGDGAQISRSAPTFVELSGD